MLFKLSYLNSNLALTLGYLKPALNNPAHLENGFKTVRFRCPDSLGSCGRKSDSCKKRLRFLTYLDFSRRSPIKRFHKTSRRPYWCSKTMKRRPCWCTRTILWELNSFLMQRLSFVPINLHRCWPREWKRSTWPASMLIYWNKRKHLLAKRVQLSEDFLGTPTWLPFHCFGTENENAVDNVIW